MKTGTDKTADVNSTTVAQAKELFFGKANEGGFFASKKSGSVSIVQAKLMVNEPGDVYEREADRVAEQVMSMPQNGAEVHEQISTVSPTQVQREGEEESIAASQPEIPEWMRQGYFLQMNRPAWSLSRGPQSPLKLNSTPVLPLRLSSPPPPSWLNDVEPWWQNLPVPYDGLDWGGVNQELSLRGALHLRDQMHDSIVAQYQANYLFLKNLGLSEEISVRWANTVLPGAVGKSIALEYPTQSEIFKNSLPKEAFKLPSLPLLNATFGGPPGNRGSLSIFGGVKSWVFRKKSAGADTGIIAPQIVSNTLATNNGQPLDPQTQGFMENRFGTDLSQVRVHTGAQAAESAAAIQAKAYTQGNNIVFGAGEYQPDSESGKRLLAHELAHVGQQEGGVRRKMQNSSLKGDFILIDKIAHLLKGYDSPKQIDEILSKFSGAGDEAIIDAWNSELLLPHLGSFTAYFDEAKKFSRYPREIAAIFRALDESDKYKETRKQRIEGIYANGPIDSDEAVQIFYYTQGLESATLDDLFTGDNEQRYDQFLLALEDDERDRLKNSVSRFEKRTLSGGSEANDIAVQDAFKDISKILKGEESEINKIWSNKNTRKLKKGKYDDVELTPQQAIQSYNRLKQLDQGQLEEFIRLYEDLYDGIDFALPVQFRKSADFGLQKGVDRGKGEEYSDRYMKLYDIAAIYRVLYNYSLSFSNLLSAILSYNKTPSTDNAKEMNNIISLQTAHLVPIALDFSLAAGEEMTKIVQMLKENVIEMGKPWELYDDQSVDQELAFLKLARLFKRRLEGESSIKESPQNSLLEIVNDNVGLLDILIKTPLKSAAGSKAEKLATDKNYTTLYFAAPGLLKALERPDIWENTGQLDTVLIMLVQAGLADEAWDIVNGHRNDQNSKLLESHGFTEKGYAPPDKAETSTEVNPQKHWWQFVKMLRGKKMIKAGRYFVEGYLDIDWIKGVDLKDFSLLETQKYMGNQIMGMELEEVENEAFNADFQKWEHADQLTGISQKPGDFSIQVDEKAGTAMIRAYYLPLKSLNVQISSRAVRAGQGHLGGFVLDLKWPVPGNEEQKEFDLRVLDLELNDLVIVQPEDMYGIGRIVLKDLHINMNQAVGNSAQMQNWSRLMERVMEAFYDIFVSLTDAVMVSMQRFMPEMLKDVQDPSRNPENPEVDLTNLVLQEFGADLNLDINFAGLEIEGLVMSQYGLIGKIAMEQTNLNLKSETTAGERTLRHTLAGYGLEISSAEVSSAKSKNLTSETFGISSMIGEAGVIPGSREKAVLGNLSNIGTGEPASRPSKARRIDFDFSGLEGEELSNGEKTLSALPFKNLTGFVEFLADTQMRIQVRDIGYLDFLTLPATLPGSPLHIDNTDDSELSGSLDELTVLLDLNSKEEQISNGLEINELTVETLKLGEVHGKKFNVVLTDSTGQVTRLELKGDAKLLGVEANGLHWSKKINADTGEKGFGLLERGKVNAASTDINQLAMTLPGAVGANLDKMTSGEISLNTLVDAGGITYHFDGKDIKATGTVSTPQAIGGFNLNAGEISGSYDPLSKFLQLKKLDISQILVPELAIKSASIDVTLPKAAAPASLTGIHAAVNIQFNPDENAENAILSIEIDEFKVNQISAFGLQVHSNVKIDDKKEALDISLPINKAGIIKSIVLKRFRFDSSEKMNEDSTSRVEWKRSVYDAKEKDPAGKPGDKGGIAGIASINIPEIKGVISNLLQVNTSLETGEISYKESTDGDYELLVAGPKAGLVGNNNQMFLEDKTNIFLNLKDPEFKEMFEAESVGIRRKNGEVVYFISNPLIKNLKVVYDDLLITIIAQVNGEVTARKGKSVFALPSTDKELPAATDSWIIESKGPLVVSHMTVELPKNNKPSADQEKLANTDRSKLINETEILEIKQKFNRIIQNQGEITPYDIWKNEGLIPTAGVPDLNAPENNTAHGDENSTAGANESYDNYYLNDEKNLARIQKENKFLEALKTASGNLKVFLFYQDEINIPLANGKADISLLPYQICDRIADYVSYQPDSSLGALGIWATNWAASIQSLYGSDSVVREALDIFFSFDWILEIIEAFAAGNGMQKIAEIIDRISVSGHLTIEEKDGLAQLFFYEFTDKFGVGKDVWYSRPLVSDEYYDGKMVDVVPLIQHQMLIAEKENKPLATQFEYDLLADKVRVEKLSDQQLVSELDRDLTLMFLQFLSTFVAEPTSLGQSKDLSLMLTFFKENLLNWTFHNLANLILNNLAFSAELNNLDIKPVEDYFNLLHKGHVEFQNGATASMSIDKSTSNLVHIKKGVIPPFIYLSEAMDKQITLGQTTINSTFLEISDKSIEIRGGMELSKFKAELKQD